MRFLINALGMNSGGVKVVGHRLGECLGKVSPGHEFMLLASNGCGYEELELPKNVELNTINTYSSIRKRIYRLYLDHVWLPYLCRKWRADVLFSMCNFGPIMVTCPHLLSLHRPQLAYQNDEIWNSCLKTEKREMEIISLYFRYIGGRADRYAVLTEPYRERLITYFSLSPERVEVVPNGIEPLPAVKEDENYSSFFRNTEKHFRLCYPAGGYPHKNHAILPEVLEVLEEDYGIDDVAVFITLPTSDMTEDLRRREHRKTGNRLVNCGPLAHENIANLYNHCQALIMPTLLEVQSLVYYEAMQAGKPVLTSDRDFARTVCGNGAIYFSPTSADSIARAIAEIKGNKLRQEELIQDGRNIVAREGLDWVTVAEKYVNILENMAK